MRGKKKTGAHRSSKNCKRCSWIKKRDKAWKKRGDPGTQMSEISDYNELETIDGLIKKDNLPSYIVLIILIFLESLFHLSCS